VKQVSLYGIVILAGVVALFSTGIATFVLGEQWRSQQIEPTASVTNLPALESVSDDIREFQLVVKETEVKFECHPEQVTESDQFLPDIKIILVNKVPDLRAPELVSFSGCPLAARCSKGAAETF